MFDSIDDWLIIAVVAGVLLYGSTKIPQLARNLGRSTGEFKRGRIEVEHEIQSQQTAEKAKTNPTGPAAVTTTAPSPPAAASAAVPGSSR